MCRTVNYRKLAGFCFGALGWSSSAFWREASLQDIADALEGYAEYVIGIGADNCQGNHPSPQFLEDMLKIFPDQ